MSDIEQADSQSTPDAEGDGASKLLDFEKQLSELEGIVKAMERGDMTLDESLRAYELGVKLTRECQSALDTAQQRIQVLSEKNGVLVEEPFEPGS